MRPHYEAFLRESVRAGSESKLLYTSLLINASVCKTEAVREQKQKLLAHGESSREKRKTENEGD